eukprot:1043138-Lingulodinium_polyedra.AAC.1
MAQCIAASRAALLPLGIGVSVPHAAHSRLGDVAAAHFIDATYTDGVVYPIQAPSAALLHRIAPLALPSRPSPS